MTGVGDGQGGLACCDSWGHKESDTTEHRVQAHNPYCLRTSLVSWYIFVSLRILFIFVTEVTKLGFAIRFLFSPKSLKGKYIP